MRISEVEVSGRLALACGGCGEVILFLGRERDWYVPAPTAGRGGSRAAGAARSLPSPTAWSKIPGLRVG